jgi:hypothetical protein
LSGNKYLITRFQASTSDTVAMAASPLGASRHIASALQGAEPLLQLEGGGRAMQPVGVARLASSSRVTRMAATFEKMTVDALKIPG